MSVLASDLDFGSDSPHLDRQRPPGCLRAAFLGLPCPSPCYIACVPLLVGPDLYLEGKYDSYASKVLTPGSRFLGQPWVGCSGISLSPSRLL